jgi:hypothetical protein
MPNHPADWRRALELLARAREGATEAHLLAHGVLPSGHNLLAGSKCIARARDGGREAITASAAAIGV